MKSFVPSLLYLSNFVNRTKTSLEATKTLLDMTDPHLLVVKVIGNLFSTPELLSALFGQLF